MFDDAQPQLEKILALVNLCPEKLQEKCFEILLGAYVASKRQPNGPALTNDLSRIKGQGGSANSNTTDIPELIKARFTSLVGRAKVLQDRAVSIFDFNVDPFNYHALAVPGTSNSEKMRNVALLLALKSYLTTATWTADWQEFRAACIDHACWDQNNSPKYMKHEWFKVASKSTGVTLSSAGTKAAESLFAKLAGATNEVT